MRTSTVSELGSPSGRDLARFEEAEQLRLEVEAELADFVEEQRAVAGGADQAEAGRGRRR